MPKVTVVTLPTDISGFPGLSAGEGEGEKEGSRFWSVSAHRLRSFWRYAHAYNHIGLNFLAVLLGRVVILGEVAPFGLAFFAAVSQLFPRYAPAVGLFSIAGVLSRGHYLEGGIQIFAIFLYFWQAEKLNRLARPFAGLCLLVFGVVFFGWAALGLLTGEQTVVYHFVKAFFAAAICVTAAAILIFSMPPVWDNKRDVIRYLNSENIFCLTALLAAAVCGMGELGLAGYHLRHVAANLLIMVLAQCGGAGLGTVAGVVMGFAISLEEGYSLTMALYAFGGVTGGFVKRFGRIAVAGGVIFGNCLIAVYFGQAMDKMVVEVMLAAMIFLLLPAGLLAAWRTSLAAPVVEPERDKISDASNKLKNIADIFADLAGMFNQITNGARSKIRDEELARVLSTVGEQVCEHCPQRQGCWETNFYRTSQAMMDLVGIAEIKELTLANMPPFFRECCNKRAELAATMNRTVECNRSIHFWQKKITDHRQMVTEQIKAASAIITNLSAEMRKEPCNNNDFAQELKEKAVLLDCRVESIRVNGFGGSACIHISKWPCQGTRECKNTLLPLVAGLLQEKINLQAKCGGKQQKCSLVLQAARRFVVETGISSSAKEGGVSGDNYSVLPLEKGKVAIILSDGMGSGKAAAGESSVAVDFLSRMLKAGFDVDAAVQTLNSMLVLKTPDENFATMDVLIVDIYSGETEFIKLGAAPSFVKRVREVGLIKSDSLPAGILNYIEIDPVKVKLSSGDIVVMVSDGIVEASRVAVDKEFWLVNYLRRLPESTPQEIADQVLREAKRLAGGVVRDDMTVLTVKIDDEV